MGHSRSRLPFAIRHLLPLTPQHRELRPDRVALQEVLAALRVTLPAEAVDELAIPSYTHGNPLMQHLFWERLAVVLERIDQFRPPPTSALDFGCGAGILFPALQRRGITVTGCDIHPQVAQESSRLLGLDEVRVLDAKLGLGSLPDNSMDIILALDVLEHVENVPALAAEFRRLLSPSGRLLCSLPTENLLYRLGRRLAGFSGAYHVHDPRQAATELASYLRVRRVARLYACLPLFDFYEATTDLPS